MNMPFPSRGQVEFTRSCYPHDGVACLLFSFKEDLQIEVGRLTAWRLQTHPHFGGTWLSDYVPNRLGGFVRE